MSQLESPAAPVVVLKTTSARDASLGVVRTLGRMDVPVYLVHGGGAGSPAASSRYLAGQLVSELQGVPGEEIVDELLSFGRRIGSRCVLIPTDDVGTLLVSEHDASLQEHFLFPRQPKGLVDSLSNKHELYLLCQKWGVPTPEITRPQSRDELEDLLETLDFPVVVKAIDPGLPRRESGQSVMIAGTPQELRNYYDRAEVPGRPNLMLQEHIPGDDTSVWMFNGYFDEGSHCLVGFTGQKVRQHPPYRGMTTLGVCRENETVRETTQELMKSIGYRGILDIGYRYDARDGEYKLLDVNPRVGATFRLFTGRDGTDVVRALYLDLAGKPVPPTSARDGRKWIVEIDDVRSALVYRRDGNLSVNQWGRSLRGVEEGAFVARDDLRPVAAECRRYLARGRQRVARSIAGRRERPSVPVSDEVLDGVRARFHLGSEEWDEMYRRHDVTAVVYQRRQELALRWIRGLGLPRAAKVLEVGCGAGVATVAMCREGFHVDAVDASPAMVDRTRRRVAKAGVSALATVTTGDANDLDFPDGLFDLVVSLGVVPWLGDVARAATEIARVLRPGGYLIISADNRRRLTYRLDPLHNPTLQPLKPPVKRALARVKLYRSKEPDPFPLLHHPAELDELARASGLTTIAGATLGFGPFTVAGKELFSTRLALRLDDRLQKAADRGARALRLAGNQYVLLARKPAEAGGTPERAAGDQALA